ncbi:TPA: hypothetical protein IAA87_07525 [Candidatus Avigastranaerophilus faecigallinarum]|nr:hypothetical protein [Candidatus Avigastranaerophilus faecigallinarum]
MTIKNNRYKYFIIGLILICTTILVGCNVNLNTKTEISINDNYKISATVLEINEEIDTAWTQKVSFIILFENNNPVNMIGANLNIYNFDLYIENYTIFDLIMMRDFQGGTISNFTIEPNEKIYITLKATINKSNITEKITDTKISLKYNNTTIFSNY